MITDPLSDTFTRIRNALSSRKKIVKVFYSKIIERIIRIFFYIGYINGFKIIKINLKPYVTILLKYNSNGISAINGIKRASKPGLRIYCNKKSFPLIYNGLGTAIISTSNGLLTTYRAKKNNTGGEVICFIW